MGGRLCNAPPFFGGTPPWPQSCPAAGKRRRPRSRRVSGPGPLAGQVCAPTSRNTHLYVDLVGLCAGGDVVGKAIARKDGQCGLREGGGARRRRRCWRGRPRAGQEHVHIGRSPGQKPAKPPPRRWQTRFHPAPHPHPCPPPVVFVSFSGFSWACMGRRPKPVASPPSPFLLAHLAEVHWQV